MSAALLNLDHRAILRLKGPDARSFLQGLVTNDVMPVTAGKAVYAAMLTPQGKYMYDMIIMADGDDLLLDIEAERKTDLMRRLMMYKLRADVAITDETDLGVWVSLEQPSANGVSVPDPRDAMLGWRLVTAEKPDAPALERDTYEQARLRLGVPDGSRDMEIEKYFWLETAAERLNGVSFTKGCYVGQELTARMKHRTNLKKMLRPVRVEGGAPEEGAVIETVEGKAAGTVRTSNGEFSLVYFRLVHEAATLTCDGKPVILL